jgi:lysophospholipase L1-like esterase
MPINNPSSGGTIATIAGLSEALGRTGRGAPATLADVLAIPDLKWCFTPDSGFFSDTAGTTEQTTDGGTVKCWKDASANADHAINATGLPLTIGAGGGCRALYVNSTAQKFITTGTFDASFDAGFTAFVVAHHPTQSANRVICSSADARFYMAHNGAANTFGPVMTAGSNLSLPIPSNIPTNTNGAGINPGVMVEAFRYNGVSTKVDMFYNGLYYLNTSNASASNPALTGALHIGGIGTGTGFQWGGHVMAVVIFNRKLTDAEIQVVNDYLSHVCRVQCTPHIRCIGDSITSGSGATRVTAGGYGTAKHGNTDWPSQLLDLLPYDNVWVRQDAYAGRSMAQFASEMAFSTQAHFIPGTNSKQIALMCIGTNTLSAGMATERPLDTPVSYTTYADLCQTLRDQGWLVGAYTLLPRGDVVASSLQKHYRMYAQFNKLIRQGYHLFADFLVDIASDPRIGFPGCENDTTYFNADKVHLTDQGYAIIAGLTKSALEPYLPAVPPRRYLSKSVAGSSNVTLTPAEFATVLAGGTLKLTGALTGNINVYLPLPVLGCSANFENATTGAFTVTLIGATGTGYVITQAKKARAYCDGTNWYQETAEL